MQKSQEQGDLSTSVQKQLVHSEIPGSQRLLAAFENASLKTQLFAIAFTAAVICTLTIVVIQNLTTPSSTAWVAGVTVGMTTLALGRLTIKQINCSLNNLKTQFEAAVQGDFTVQATVYSSPELGTLAMSFNQMIQAINTRLNEAEQKAAEQEKENEDLQQKLLQIIHNLDFTGNNSLEATIATNEDDELSEAPPGSLLEFLDNFHKWSQLPTAPELLLGSSTLEEIQQRKDQLQYRQVWLQAIMEETQREIKLISPIAQLGDKNNVKEINED
jgi:HAMP domain-containing protein